MPSSPPTCSKHQPSTRQRQEPQQHTADDQRDVRAAATAMTFALRKQWTAKAASFQRGLEHVQLCTAGDACGSSLCHSTRRLMRTVASHQCPPQQTGDKKHCRVCKLWDFLTAKQQPLPTLQRALALQSCGSAWIQPRRLSAGQRRVLATHKDVTQRRF